ncbi:hypothetical protein CSQ79_16950 [Gloeocapsopsis sp. IPPAS B-1203]|nr:hypothetical protein CSQ79_16950 [Gloeocapsopsis sp. IPPAS B-1203]
MNNCPCCSDQLLRHIHNHEVYFFCRTCWQEMPVLSEEYNLYPKKVIRLSTLLYQPKQRNASYCNIRNQENIRTTLISV